MGYELIHRYICDLCGDGMHEMDRREYHWDHVAPSKGWVEIEPNGLTHLSKIINDPTLKQGGSPLPIKTIEKMAMLHVCPYACARCGDEVPKDENNNDNR